MERSFLLQEKDRYLKAQEMNVYVLSCEDNWSAFFHFLADVLVWIFALWKNNSNSKKNLFTF